MGTIPDSVVGASIPAGPTGHVLYRLEHLSDSQGRVQVCATELARLTAYSVRSIWRHLAALEREGFLTRIRSTGGRGNYANVRLKTMPRTMTETVPRASKPRRRVKSSDTPPIPPQDLELKAKPQVTEVLKLVSPQKVVKQNPTDSVQRESMTGSISEAIGAYVQGYQSKRPNLRVTPGERGRVGKAARELLEVGNPAGAVIEAAYRCGVDGQPGLVQRKIGDIGKVNEPKGWEGYRQWLATKQ